MDDKLVYHYTSIEAFRSLIESVPKSSTGDCFLFRASNILFMNDPNEFYFGRKVFIKTLKEIEDLLEIKDEIRLSLPWTEISAIDEKEKDKEYLQYLMNLKQIPYVLSFSHLEDSLPMWLNYANNGKGVCLAFLDERNHPIREKMNGDVRKVSESFFTSDVFYGNIDKNSCLYDIILKTMKDYKDDVLTDYIGLKDAYFDTLIQYAAPFIKTQHYMNEYEVRVSKTISFDYGSKDGIAKFRTNKLGNIVPYVDVEIPVENLKFVVLGPLVETDLTRLALEMMVGEYLDKRIDIRSSNVKYREY